MKKLLALLLTLCLLGLPALAAEPEELLIAPAPGEGPSAWAVEYLADAYSLKLVDDASVGALQSPATLEQLQALAELVGQKLALLGLPAREGTQDALVLDATRGGMVNAYYQALAAWDVPGITDDPVDTLVGMGVLLGDETGLALERQATGQEAVVLATRIVLAAYDAQGAGSKGLLWKAEDPETGNVLYLLGTAHMDRGDVYPFHKTLREAITGAETVILELDLNDQAGMAELAAMQSYTDGTGLKDHISQELYDRTVAAFGALGLTEEQVNGYKPWALGNTVQSLLASGETGAGAMAIDLYVNTAAANIGVPVVGAETYALQGGIFDGLSAEYQSVYLETYVAMLEAALAGGETAADDQEAQELLELQQSQLDALMTAWKTGDVPAMEELLDKATVVTSDDELSAKLFTERDPGMIAVADAYLKGDGADGGHTYFMAVGAGHMLDPGGIVSGLRALGYTVEQVK